MSRHRRSGSRPTCISKSGRSWRQTAYPIRLKPFTQCNYDVKKVHTSRLVLPWMRRLCDRLLGCGSFANEVSRAEVTTLSASPLGINGMTVNGRIRPHGLSTRYWFEYGLDANYGKKSVSQPLAPKLGAYYQETWDRGSAGWIGGMSGKDLKHVPDEGERNGFIRYSEPSGDDTN